MAKISEKFWEILTESEGEVMRALWKVNLNENVYNAGDEFEVYEQMRSIGYSIEAELINCKKCVDEELNRKLHIIGRSLYKTGLCDFEEVEMTLETFLVNAGYKDRDLRRDIINCIVKYIELLEDLEDDEFLQEISR